MRKSAKLFIFIVLFLLVSGCNATPTVTLKGATYRVEIADTDERRQLGLMFRESMPADQGMLFLFPRAKPQSFWMKNTLIPLDIMYFDENWRLVSWHENVPPCKTRRCPSYPSGLPAKYVLELNAGEGSKLGIKPGDELVYSP